jgi:hypothetical protein
VASVVLLALDWFHALVALNLAYIGFFLSMISIYLARTYKDVVGRPISVVDWRRSSLKRDFSETTAQDRL